MTARQSAIVFLAAQASRLPRGVARTALGAAGLVSVCARPHRLQLARAWVSAYEMDPQRRWWTLLKVLSHGGQSVVDHWAPVFETPAELRQRVRLEGREHLDALVGRPSIGLGFHVGASLGQWVLNAYGFDCYALTRTGEWGFRGRARPKPGWSDGAIEQRVRISLRADDQQGRAQAVLRMRALLKQNRCVLIAGDGMTGREIFRVPVATGALIVRRGWWFLRRETGAAVVPILSRWEGSRVVVTVYPPLPDPVADPDADLDLCRERLVPLIEDFVRQHPEQCSPWRFAIQGPDT